MGLESNQKVIGYSDGIYSTIVPVSFHGRLIVTVAHRVHTWVRLEVTFFLVACTASSGTMKAS